MKKFKILTGTLLLCLSIYGQKKPLTASEVQLFKQRVETNAASIKTLKNTFEQVKHLDFVENDIRSTGNLFFKAPQQIRWEYNSPFHYYVIFDQEQIRINDGGRKKEVDISSNKMLKDLNKILVGTVQGKAIFDDSKFSISYYKSGTAYLSTFLPKDKVISTYIKQIDLTFNESSYLVTKIRITEPSLDYTEILFSNQQKNSPIPDATFSAR